MPAGELATSPRPWEHSFQVVFSLKFNLVYLFESSSPISSTKKWTLLIQIKQNEQKKQETLGTKKQNKL